MSELGAWEKFLQLSATIGDFTLNFPKNLRRGVKKISPYAWAFLALIIPTIIVTLFITKEEVAGVWYDNNWDYRVPVTITYSGTTLTNHDVVISLNTTSLITATKMQADCDDIRVTDSDETTLISYWVEGGCNTSTTQIWVRVPSIPNGGKTIYVYYGNSGATNAEQAWSGNFTLLYNNTCPAGWTRNSAFDDKFIRGNSSYGGTGGTQGHTHGAIAASISSGGGSTYVDTGSSEQSCNQNHSHSATVYPAANNDTRPPYLNMVYCYNSDLRFENGMISLFTTTPAGFTRFTALDNKFPQGAATYGGTGGATTHTHTYPNAGTTGCSAGCTVGSAIDVVGSHSHTIAADSMNTATSLPLYRTMVYASANSSTAPPAGTIVITSVAPPLGYTRYSALDTRFPYGSATAGTNSGTSTHFHTKSAVISSSAKADCNEQNDKLVSSDVGHYHNVTLTSDSRNHTPPYIDVLLYQRNTPSVTTAIGSEEINNIPPNTPTLDVPVNTATSQSWHAALKTTATDDDSDYLQYKIELCTDVAMTLSCQTFDQTSSQTGWSGQNAQTSTAYTSGTQATYTIQTALTASTTYYWRSYAIDPAGVNTWSSTQGSPYSFTTDDIPNPPVQCSLEKANDNSYININWVDNSDDETGFLVERSENDLVYDSLDDTLANVTTFQDTTIVEGKKYEYRVSAYKNYGSTIYNSDWCYASQAAPATGIFKIN